MDISRPQNELEKKNFKSLGKRDNYRNKDYLQRMRGLMAEYELDCVHKRRVPFCSKCACDAVDEVLEKARKAAIKNSRKGEDEIKVNADIDFAKFEGKDKFENIGESEEINDKLIDGIRQSVTTGKYIHYVCKTCSSNFSMLMQNTELLDKKRTKIDDGIKR